MKNSKNKKRLIALIAFLIMISCTFSYVVYQKFNQDRKIETTLQEFKRHKSSLNSVIKKQETTQDDIQLKIDNSKSEIKSLDEELLELSNLEQQQSQTINELESKIKDMEKQLNE